MITTIKDKTARKQVPAIYRKVKNLSGWYAGTVNLDIGGGPYNLFTEKLAEEGVVNLIYDPKNRSDEHNEAILTLLQDKADTCTISNVLCVIEDPNERKQVLEFAKEHTSGMVYITVYEGDKSGVGNKTRDGYQNNREIEDYLEEIMEVFPRISLQYDMVVAHV